MGYRRKYPPVVLPPNRRLCRKCQALRDRNQTVPDVCNMCLNRNWHLIPDDGRLEAWEAEIDAHYRKRRAGLKRYQKKFRGADQIRRGSHSGRLASLTPEQRQQYEELLARALQRAKLAGKRIDGPHLQPYRMGCLSVVVRTPEFIRATGAMGWKKTARIRGLRGCATRLRKARMLAKAGLIKPEPEETPWVAPKPRSVYLSLG